MVNYYHYFIGLLILQVYVSAAPSDITKTEPIESLEVPLEDVKLEEPSESTNLEDSSQDAHLEEPLKEETKEEVVEVNPEEPKLDSQPPLVEESKLDNSPQSQRQKRFYNFYGYGVPPINPVVYPSYNKRDQSGETGVYGLEDPIEQIHRRLHDIASFVRQPAPPPPPQSHFPFFYPVIYIPQFSCDCNNAPRPENPQTQRPEANQTMPEPDKRFPDLSDDRQNWGVVTNETDAEYDEDEFARPISFDPILPNGPMMRPAPPVEHGSSQGNSNTPQTTTVRPAYPTRRPSPRPTRPPTSFAPAQPGQSSFPSSFGNDIPRNEQPSTCDGAVLSCCHQPYLTYDCFVTQGCPDLRSFGNPCDPQVILQVIDKFQKFYGVRN